MKLHIDQTQLNELSEKGKKKLRKWWKPKKDDKAYSWWKDKHNVDNPRLTKPLPLLSIGQMIEFLEDDWWEKLTQIIGYGNDAYVDGDKNKDLADALWEAVKEVLNER